MTELDKKSVSVVVNGDMKASDVQRLVDRALEPATAVASDDKEEARDYTDFAELEPLVLDLAAMLKVYSKLDTALVCGESVKLSYRQVRVLHRLLFTEAPDLNELESILQNFHNDIIGGRYDHALDD